MLFCVVLKQTRGGTFCEWVRDRSWGEVAPAIRGQSCGCAGLRAAGVGALPGCHPRRTPRVGRHSAQAVRGEATRRAARAVGRTDVGVTYEPVRSSRHRQIHLQARCPGVTRGAEAKSRTRASSAGGLVQGKEHNRAPGR
jgi:hypothetical protein